MNPAQSTLEWLLTVTLRASSLAFIILAIQLVLQRWLSAQWRYALWLPMVLVLLLPALPSVPFGLFPQRSAEMPMAISQRMTDLGTILVETRKPPETAIKIISTGAPSPILLGWLFGVSGLLGVGVVSYRLSMWRIVKTVVIPDEALLHLIGSAAREAGLERMPRVLVSPRVNSPAVTGIFLPSLLLPAGFPVGFTEGEARLILLHEFTHLKRHDLSLNWLAWGLQAVHWFNPVLWFAFARMRADREAACDAQVLSIGSTDRRAEYGHALLKLQTGFPASGLSLGFVGIFERTAGMKSRILQISSHRPVGLAQRASGACLVALLITFGVTKAQEPVNPKVELKAVEPMTIGRAYIEKKLDTIVIPKVEVENAVLEEMVDVLRQYSRQFDTEKNPAQKGINFVLKKPSEEDHAIFKPRLITFQKNNITLRGLVIEIRKQSGMEFKVDDFGLVFFPPEVAEKLEKVAPMPKLTGKAAEFAQKLIIPEINFKDTTLREALDFLNARAKELTKDGPVYPIVLDSKADPNAKISELHFKNMPLSHVLKYSMDSAKHTWTADDHEIQILPR
jgi:bla regulator protein blaR1